MGYYSHSFNDSTSASFAKTANEENTTISGDFFGLYWPSQSHPGWIRGFVLNFDATQLYTFEDSFGSKVATSSIGINQSLYGFSNFYFIRKEVGTGFFLRGDIGLALADVSTFRTNAGDRNEKSFGLGSLVGMGGSFPISDGTRFLTMVTYKKSITGDYDIPVVGISAGLLF